MTDLIQSLALLVFMVLLAIHTYHLRQLNKWVRNVESLVASEQDQTRTRLRRLEMKVGE